MAFGALMRTIARSRAVQFIVAHGVTILVVMGVAAIVLGYVGWSQHNNTQGTPQSFGTTLYSTLSLFSLGSLSEPDPLPLTLSVARFLAPLTLASAAFGALVRLLHHDALRLWARLVYREPILVVVGLGPAGVRLLEQATVEEGVDSYAIDVSSDDAGRVAAGDLGIPVITSGSSLDGPTMNQLAAALRRARVVRADTVVIATGDDDLSARTASALTTVLVSDQTRADAGSSDSEASDAARARERRHRPSIFVEVGDPDTVRWLQDELPPPGSANVEFFSLTDRAARAILEGPTGDAISLQPASDGPTDPHLLVVGEGTLAASVVIQAAVGWGVDRVALDESVSVRPRVTLYAPGLDDPAGHAMALRRWHPGIDDGSEVDRGSSTLCELRVLTDHQSLASHLDDAPAPLAVVVAAPDDHAGIHHVHELRPLVGSIPITLCAGQRGGLAELAMRSGQAHVFPVLDETMKLGSIRHGVSDDLARTLQASDRRLRRARTGSDSDDPADREWQDLSEEVRDLNRAAVDGWRTALDRLGRRVVRRRVDGPGGVDLDESEVELVAEHLHEFWRASRESHDWQYAEESDRARHRHADLVPWRDLGDRSWNLAQARRLPDLLAAMGFEIAAGPRPSR